VKRFSIHFLLHPPHFHCILRTWFAQTWAPDGRGAPSKRCAPRCAIAPFRAPLGGLQKTSCAACVPIASVRVALPRTHARQGTLHTRLCHRARRHAIWSLPFARARVKLPLVVLDVKTDLQDAARRAKAWIHARRRRRRANIAPKMCQFAARSRRASVCVQRNESV
jgi:hypothetical protein